MTIDEAISHAREKADKNSGYWKYCTDIKDCKTCEKEYEQLAEWLEELKALKNRLNIKCDNLNEALEKGKKIGYNKALYDFVKFASDMPTVEEEDGEIRPMWLEEIAEQLKVGGENERSI